jgi:cysteine-rich repeat protein
MPIPRDWRSHSTFRALTTHLFAVCLMAPGLLMLPACGDGHSPPPAPDGGTGKIYDEEGCQILTLERPRLWATPGFFATTGLRYPVVTPLDGARADFLYLELFGPDVVGGLPPLTTGSIDLSAAPNNDLATCQHCMWLKVDEQPDTDPKVIYYQSKGTLTLSQVTEPLDIFAGNTSRIVFRRAKLKDDQGHIEFEPGGDCVSITPLSFNTTPTPGKACQSAEDCGNTGSEICDPTQNICTRAQCDGEEVFCPEGQTCVAQVGILGVDAFIGACYAHCDPTVASGECGPVERCVQFGVNPQGGICKRIGDGAVGAACRLEDNSTSCAETAVCSAASLTCTHSCPFFDAVSGCPDYSRCSLFGVCEPPSAGSAAEIGTPCGPEANPATGCGRDGEAFRGICFNDRYPNEPLLCQKACFIDLENNSRGCGDGEFCALRFESGLGVCLPIPVCGDGQRGEINEVCDDGNTNDGDGCSGDCQTVGYQYLCANAITPIPIATNGDTPVAVPGNTATAGVDGFFASCQAGVAKAQLFKVTPPGPGQLHLHLATVSNHILSVLRDCANAGSETACQDGEFDVSHDKDLVIQVRNANPAPLTVVVSADTFLEEGPFTLSADFVPEQCGDGVVVGNEVCDDGNTAGGDVCSADCRQIDYDSYCASAPLLSTSESNLGDTTGEPNYFDGSCSFGGGPDRLYRYIAPHSGGTLHLRLLPENAALLNLVVYDRCGTPGAILREFMVTTREDDGTDVTRAICLAGYSPAEVDLPLAADQQISILVEGSSPHYNGSYSLDAMFTPSTPAQ